MAINRIDGVPGLPRPDNTGDSKGARARSSESAPAAGGDRVELSEEARQAAALRARADELPEVRDDRVEAVRKALRTGTYEVDPRQLARAILEFEDEVGG